MPKFKGPIGYVKKQEIRPGVWDSIATEKTYRGDILQNTNKWQKSENLNDDLNIDNKLSILSDPYAYANISSIKYVRWMGTNWKVNKIEVNRPRLILTIGGVYNGKTASIT